MTLLEREDSLFGEKNNKRPLMRSNTDYKDPQSYIYPTDMDDSNCIQILVSSPLVMHWLPNSEWTVKAHCLCQQKNARGS